MTNDLISRANAIKAIDEWIQCGFDRDDDIAISEFLSFLKEDIHSIPSAQPKQGEWIPCDIKMPEKRRSVLIAVNSKYGDWVGEGCYWETTENHTIWKGYRWNATYWDDEIIAWMPLPQPYNGARMTERSRR